MATTIERNGGFLKITTDGAYNEPINLLTCEPKIKGGLIYFENGDIVDFNDVSTPTVASVEDVMDAIGTFIEEYNTGQ